MTYFFVSYSHKNKDRLQALLKEIKNRNFPIWIDEQIRVGRSWRGELGKAIRECAGIVLMMSSDSAASGNVEDEIDYAQRIGKPIFPILLDDLGDCDFWYLRRLQHVDGRKKLKENFFSELALALHSGQQVLNFNEAETEKFVQEIEARAIWRERTRRDIEDYLKECAKSGELPITYGRVADQFDINLGSIGERNRFFHFLGDISVSENAQNRPLLSAIVVNSSEDYPYPGKGFYHLARMLKPKYAKLDDITIYALEFKDIQKYWQNKE